MIFRRVLRKARGGPQSVLMALVGCAVLASACASGPRRSGGGGTRCDSIRKAVASVENLSTATVPVPRDPVMPPYPAPTAAQGKDLVVRALVSERGRVDAHNVQVEGSAAYPGWARQFAAEFARTPFEAARYEGCAIARWVNTTYNIENH